MTPVIEKLQKSPGIIHHPKTQHFKGKKFLVKGRVNLSLPPEFFS
jgi:hypothetical protein